MSTAWTAVWRDRRPANSGQPTLAVLLAAGGYDSGFAGSVEPAWGRAARRRAAELALGEGDSVFDVGCGAGAFLYELAALGCSVGGLDVSPGLIALARAALPDGDFQVAEAIELARRPQVDVVLSVSAFLYFPTLAYAELVLDAMVARARRAVAIYDLPDAARRRADIARRERLAGGRDRYAERYAGLEHCYYERDWVTRALAARGLRDVRTADADLEGYGNAPYRFNAWGFAAGAAARGLPASRSRGGASPHAQLGVDRAQEGVDIEPHRV